MINTGRWISCGGNWPASEPGEHLLQFAAICIIGHNQGAAHAIDSGQRCSRIYRLLTEEAEKERRSLAQQVVAVLARGLQVELDCKARRQKLLRAVQPLDRSATRGLSHPAKLIREDRRR